MLITVSKQDANIGSRLYISFIKWLDSAECILNVVKWIQLKFLYDIQIITGVFFIGTKFRSDMMRSCSVSVFRLSCQEPCRILLSALWIRVADTVLGGEGYSTVLQGLRKLSDSFSAIGCNSVTNTWIIYRNLVLSHQIVIPWPWYFQDVSGDGELIPGHSTADALRILHDELLEVLTSHQQQQTYESWWSRWQRCFLHHDNHQSPFHWTSVLIQVLLAMGLLVAYGNQEIKYVALARCDAYD